MIGAPEEDDGSNLHEGAAYLFVRNGDTWTQLARITATNGAANDKFGFSVDIDGNTLIVGAPYADEFGTDARGAAYIYTFDSLGITSEVKVTNSCDWGCTTQDPGDNYNGELFGFSVSIDGNNAVIGSPWDDVDNDPFTGDRGSATIVTKTGSSWPSNGTKTPGEQLNAGFGHSVSISGDLILVGAPDYDVGANTSTGAVYRYGPSGLTWGNTPSSPTYTGQNYGSYLGFSVAIFDGTGDIGDVAVIGAPFEGAGGKAYTSNRTSSTAWTTITALPYTHSGAEFGHAVGVDEDMIVVGDFSGNGQGSAQIFRYVSGNWAHRAGIVGETTTSYHDGFAGAVGINGNQIIAGRYAWIDGTASIFVNVPHRPFDYEADGKSNISVFRPANDTWYISPSGGGQWGDGGTDNITPADFDGDGEVDFAVFRPGSQGVWYILNSSTGQPSYPNFGTTGDIPLPNDFDGDGKADIAIFRPSTATWWWTRSSDSQSANIQLSAHSGGTPVMADFDGDGHGELAVFNSGSWYWYNLVTQQTGSISYGTMGTSLPLATSMAI